MNRYLLDYEQLDSKYKELWPIKQYLKMRQMIDRHYGTFARSKELYARLTNELLEEYPMYEVVRNVLDEKHKSLDEVDRFTETFLVGMERDLFVITDIQEVIERKGMLEFRLIRREDME